MASLNPALSVIIPTFNNLPVLQRCLQSWREFADGEPIEIVVIEDGCRDETAKYLRETCETPWGNRYVRWFHEDDVGELRCNNRGFMEATAPLMLVWHDDMFLQSRQLLTELRATLESYPEIGLLSLSRGLDCFPLDEQIATFEDLLDWRRLKSTIGEGMFNWFKLQEVDIVVRPWVVRRECLEKVGFLDEAFCPHEWDEADLCLRIRQAGWKVATHGYERAGFYTHLGSTTISKKPAAKQQQLSLTNGLLFHERWGERIRAEHARTRRTWWRRTPLKGWSTTLFQMPRFALKRKTTAKGHEQNS